MFTQNLQKSGFNLMHPVELDMLAHACDTNTEAGRSDIQGHLQSEPHEILSQKIKSEHIKENCRDGLST